MVDSRVTMRPMTFDSETGRIQFGDGYYAPLDQSEAEWETNIFRFCLVAVFGAIMCELPELG